jgi:hypothetical protein
MNGDGQPADKIPAVPSRDVKGSAPSARDPDATLDISVAGAPAPERPR